MSGQDVHALAGAYALGALADEAERQAFEEHLAGCPVCAEEVGGLLATSAVLGRAVGLPAPAGLRDRVLTELDRVPQEQAQAPIARPRTVGRRRFAVAVLAAAAVAVVAGSGAYVLGGKQKADEASSADRAMAAVLSSTDARATTGKISGGGTMIVVSSAEQRRAVVVLHYLPALPASKTYEMWMMSPSKVRPAGLLRPDHVGHAGARVLSIPAGSDRVGLTVEPAGGSPQPTTAPIAIQAL
jgi:anti-sigma-K factor RskA